MAGEQSAYTATGNPILITDTYMSDIANAIRAKTGSVDTYTPAQMASAISAIETGGSSAFNALIGSERNKYYMITIGPNSTNYLNIPIGTTYNSSLIDKRQIRFLIGISPGMILIYVREAWLDYGYRTAYASRTAVPLSSFNLTTSTSQHKSWVSSYSSPTTGAYCLSKSQLENYNSSSKTLDIYYMSNTGDLLSTSSTSNSLGKWFWYGLYDHKDSIPTE